VSAATAFMSTTTAPGSIHQQVLLYWPEATRIAAAALLQIRAEIRASLQPGLDHTVAHTRLAWWHDELARTLRGSAAHPLTRQLQQSLGLQLAGASDLTALARAAALELAGAPLADAAIRRDWCAADTGTLFAIGAQLLGATAQQYWARDAGTQLQAIEWLLLHATDSGEVASELQQLRLQTGALPSAAQAGLRPLLVWISLAHRRALRAASLAPDTGEVSLWQGFTQNIAAWSAARAAANGRFQLPI